MKKQALRRILSLMLCLILCLTMLPACALAESGLAEDTPVETDASGGPEALAEEPAEPVEEAEEPVEEAEGPVEEPEVPAEEPEAPAEESEEPADEDIGGEAIQDDAPDAELFSGCSGEESVLDPPVLGADMNDTRGSGSGWITDGYGRYYYIDGSGQTVVGWKKIDGTWYFFEDDGLMAFDGAYRTAYDAGTGRWKYYFFKSSGAWDSSPGWKQGRGGYWYYADSSGLLVTGWKKINGTWYFFDDYCSMVSYDVYKTDYDAGTGQWKYYYFKPSGAWDNSEGIKTNRRGDRYYVGSNGRVAFGWQTIDGKKYYFNAFNAKMYCNNAYSIDGKLYLFGNNGLITAAGWHKTVNRHPYTDYVYSNWYYLNSDGSLVTGWKKISGKWYYFDPDRDAVMLSNCRKTIGGKTYLFTASGALAGGGWNWIGGTKIDPNDQPYDWSEWYYTNDDGTVVSGWKQINGKWYYFEPSMLDNGFHTIDGKKCFFASSGAMASLCWVKKENENSLDGYNWYYAGDSGALVKGWLLYNDRWYYFDPDTCIMIRSGNFTIDGTEYVFADSGARAAGGWRKCTGLWYDANGREQQIRWFYTNADGTPVKGWAQVGGKWYYLDPADGTMYPGGSYQIDGETYTFGENGACVNK